MGTLSQALGSNGPGTKVVVNGKEWTLTRSTKNMQAAWGAWLADRAETGAMHMASKMRKEARRLYKEARAIQAQSEEDNSLEKEAEYRDKYEETVAEARSLEVEAAKQIERFNDRKAAGEFEFHGNVGINLAQQNLPGQFMLVWLCLQPKHPGVTMEEVVESHQNNVYVWRDALLKSEGVETEKNDEEASSASTPIQPMPTTTEPASAPASL